eukprot:m.298851 g.298851  ORF g.298851 m.298851 type:complete len:239 (+) comp19541_c0_seq3:1355-2071(+)
MASWNARLGDLHRDRLERARRPDAAPRQRHTLALDGLKTPVVYQEFAGEALGSHCWEAGLYLSRLVAKQQYLVKGKRCVELGAGIGLCSVVAAMSGALHAHATDVHNQPLLDLALLNARLNDIPEDKFSVAPLDWLADTDHLGQLGVAEVVLAADVVYDPALHAALERVLCQFASVPGSHGLEVLLAYKQRNVGSEADFLRRLEACGFTECNLTEEMAAVPPPSRTRVHRLCARGNQG